MQLYSGYDVCLYMRYIATVKVGSSKKKIHPLSLLRQYDFLFLKTIHHRGNVSSAMQLLKRVSQIERNRFYSSACNI